MCKKYSACFTALLFLLLVPLQSASATDNKIKVDFAQAYQMAVDNSIDVKKSELNRDIAQKNYNNATDAFRGVLINSFNSNTSTFSSASASSEVNVHNKKYDYAVKSREVETTLEALHMKVFTKYYKVINDQKDLTAKTLDAHKSAKNLQIAQVKFQLGLESELGLLQQQALAQTADAAKTTAQDNLARDTSELLDLLGLNEGTQLELDEEILHQPLIIENLEAKIQEIAQNSPAVWSAKEAEDLQRKTLGMSNSYDIDKQKVDLAGETVKGAQLSMEESLRKLYYQVKTLEENYKTLKVSLNASEKALDNARIRYNLGLATELEVLGSESELANIRQKLFNLVYEHARLVKGFEKPWTL